MRRGVGPVLILAMTALLTACDRSAPADEQAAAQGPVETPVRKPGLWEQTMSFEGVDVLQSVRLCLDEATDKEIAWWGQQGVRSGCAKNEVKRNPDGSWSFSTVCTMAEGVRTTSNGRAIGDFNSRYQVTAETTTIGAPNPQLNGTRNITIDATWVSECPAGMVPGEMELPSGQRVNILDLSAAPPA